VSDVIASAGQLGENDVTRHHDVLGGGRDSAYSEADAIEALVHVASDLCREASGFLLTPVGGLQPSLLVALNNRAITTGEASTVLVNTGDVVTLLPPIAGG
jgi:molybdopterin converting factor small subunit